MRDMEIIMVVRAAYPRTKLVYGVLLRDLLALTQSVSRRSANRYFCRAGVICRRSLALVRVCRGPIVGWAISVLHVEYTRTAKGHKIIIAGTVSYAHINSTGWAEVVTCACSES
jgi:hypothetical protein